jgi:hypothetical protein
MRQTSAVRVVFLLTQRGLLASLILLLACQRETGPATWQVKGKVVRRGAPLKLPEGSSILFRSVSDPPVQASGEIRPDGTFELWSDLGKPGTVAGEHRVMILTPLLEVGQKPPIPPRYQSYDTSGLKATVAPNHRNELTIELD